MLLKEQKKAMKNNDDALAIKMKRLLRKADDVEILVKFKDVKKL